MTLADVLAAFEETTDRPVVQRGARRHGGPRETRAPPQGRKNAGQTPATTLQTATPPRWGPRAPGGPPPVPHEAPAPPPPPPTSPSGEEVGHGRPQASSWLPSM